MKNKHSTSTIRKNEIRISHLNIQSMNKIDQLKNYLASNKIDIMSLNETFLNQNKKITIPNYTLVRKDRFSGPGGGVALIIHNTIDFNLIQCKYDTESITVKIINLINSSEHLFLTTYYNPPDKKLNIDFLNHIFSLSRNSLLVGDLNSHHDYWYGEKRDANGNKIYKFISEKNLMVLNDDSPTYQSHRLKSSCSVIDLALTTSEFSTEVKKFQVSDKIHSDHSTLEISIHYNGPSIGALKSDKTEIKIKNTDFDKMRKLILHTISRTNLSPPTSPSEIELQSIKLSEIIKEAFLVSTTNKSIYINNNKPNFLPSNIISLIKEKRKLRRRLQKRHCPFIKKEFYILEKHIKFSIIKFKEEKWKNYWNSLNQMKISESKFWKEISSIDGEMSKSRKQPKLLEGDTLMTDPIAVSNVFAKHFENVFSNHEIQILLSTSTMKSLKSMITFSNTKALNSAILMNTI